MDKLQIINQEIFHEFVGEDAENAAHMANLFVAQAQSYVAELNSSLEYKSVQEWHDVSHKLKGMAGFAGAECLRDVCVFAQDNWKAPDDEKTKIFQNIKSEAAKAIEFFQNKYGVAP